MKSEKKDFLLNPMDLEDFWHQMRQLVRQELRKLLEEYVPDNKLPEPVGFIDKPLYTIPEICKLFDITRPTMYEWIKDEKLHPKKMRGRVFFIGSQVRHLIDVMKGFDNQKDNVA